MKKWYVEISADTTKEGQLLAEIESPEVDQQLDQAKAQLATAQANLKLAKITMDRDLGLLKDAIPKQDVDNAVGAYEADKATVDSMTANMKHLEQLVAFEKVYAPFDGVITTRNTDTRGADQRGQQRRGATTVHAGRDENTARVCERPAELFRDRRRRGWWRT